MMAEFHSPVFFFQALAIMAYWCSKIELLMLVRTRVFLQ